MSKGRSLAATYADRINGQWQQSTQAIIDTGRLLHEAKAKLVPADFEDMLDGQLKFGERTAQRLMKIAGDKRILATHVSLLPNHWSTLHALTGLDDELFNAALRDGLIRADMERKDVPKPRKEAAPTARRPLTIDHDPAPGVTDHDPETGEVMEELSAPETVAPQVPAETSGNAGLAAGKTKSDSSACFEGAVADLSRGQDSEGHEHAESAVGADAGETAADATNEAVTAGETATHLNPDRGYMGAEEPKGLIGSSPALGTSVANVSVGATAGETATHDTLLPIFHRWFPTTKPADDLPGLIAQFDVGLMALRRQAAIAGQAQARSGITIDPSDPALTFETCIALAITAAGGIDLERSALSFRPPLYPDDAEIFANRLNEWSQFFRDHHPGGNQAAIDAEAAA